MKAYKWCIKEKNKYFPLINYGIHPRIKATCLPYEMGKNYIEYEDLLPLRIRKPSIMCSPGFHFFDSLKPRYWWILYCNYLRHYQQPSINAIIECEVERKHILFEGKEQIIATQFRTLKEV